MVDPDNPDTWPPHLREADICKRRDYPGLVPLTKSAWRAAVSRGDIEQPTRFRRPRVHLDQTASLARQAARYSPPVGGGSIGSGSPL